MTAIIITIIEATGCMAVGQNITRSKIVATVQNQHRWRSRRQLVVHTHTHARSHTGAQLFTMLEQLETV